MLDACKQCGWSRVYWRVLDGGRAVYRSKLVRPMGRWDDDSFWSPKSESDKALLRRYTSTMTDEQRADLLRKFDDLNYATFDPLKAAIHYAQKIGLQLHAWIPINEDDHGWGLQSEFSKAHPQFRWKGRNGKTYRSQLSFAFEEVRQYKLSIIEELLRNYELDGLFLDWIRTGDVRDNPQNDSQGVADYGWEKPLLERWRSTASNSSKTADSPKLPENGDEAWIRIRAEPQTIFMRAVRKLVTKHRPSRPIAALVGHPWHYRGEVDKIDGNLRGLLLDVATWSREKLVDAVVPAGYYRDGGNAELAYGALRKETEGRMDVWTYAWVPSTPADLDQAFALADKVEAKQILFWEADYIDDRANSAELKAAFRKRAGSF